MIDKIKIRQNMNVETEKKINEEAGTVQKNDYQVEDMRKLCRDIFGTDNADELRVIARKAEEYDQMMNREHAVNVRGAGRKQRFVQEDMDYLIELYHQGETVTWLAEYFGVSRPTIYKYLKSDIRFAQWK